MENEIEKPNLPNPAEEAEQRVIDEAGSVADTDDAETLKTKNQSLYEQLKKAKGFVRGADGKWVKKTPAAAPKVETKPTETTNLSSTDMYALMNAKVHEEDIAEVQKYAKLEGITIAEALKSNIVKTILKERAETRATAEATHTGTAPRGTKKADGADLLEKASETGELPDSDDDIAEMVNARHEKKTQKK